MCYVHHYVCEINVRKKIGTMCIVGSAVFVVCFFVCLKILISEAIRCILFHCVVLCIVFV